jgi:hypothetical protein
MSMSSEDVAGRLTVVIWNRTLWWAVDELVEKLTPEQLRKLKVRSGEHLAAILTTTFLRTAPTQVDTMGDVDLWFDLAQAQEPRPVGILPARATHAAFEVKSLPGGYREFDAASDRDAARGVDPIGRSMDGMMRAAKDVLREARPSLDDAQNQLLSKPRSEGTSMNVFLVVHLLDYLTAECFKEVVIGPYLDPLEDLDDIDTVWVLWPPHHLTMWSRERREWMNLMFDGMNPDEVSARQQRPIALPFLQEAEQYFLTRSGHTDRSPYFFEVTFGETDDSESS